MDLTATNIERLLCDSPPTFPRWWIFGIWLANFRYKGGVTSYLEVLYNEQELFSAELTMAQAQRNELLAVIQLYRALGGGWQSHP